MLSPDNLPSWPRWLNQELAAAYLGRTVRKFLKEVGKKWPLPGDKQGKDFYWDRLALDRASDLISGHSDHVSSRAEQELEKWAQSSD